MSDDENTYDEDERKRVVNVYLHPPGKPPILLASESADELWTFDLPLIGFNPESTISVEVSTQ